MIKKWFHKFWGWVKPYLTPKMIPILLTVWSITNGVWYFFAFVDIGLPTWFMSFAKGYLLILYMPFTIEKPIIIAISLFIYRVIYKEKFNRGDKE